MKKIALIVTALSLTKVLGYDSSRQECIVLDSIIKQNTENAQKAKKKFTQWKCHIEDYKPRAGRIFVFLGKRIRIVPETKPPKGCIEEQPCEEDRGF